MSQSANEIKDEFELELEKQTKILQSCQTSRELKSCFKCEKLFDCEIRKSYVDAVYNSMSKGDSGGFEF